jgi:hypothetical protein
MLGKQTVKKGCTAKEHLINSLTCKMATKRLLKITFLAAVRGKFICGATP